MLLILCHCEQKGTAMNVSKKPQYIALSCRCQTCRTSLPEAVRQNPWAAKIKRKSDSEDNQFFILQIVQCMSQQSEITTRLQEKMVEVGMPTARSNPSTGQLLPSAKASIMDGSVGPISWYREHFTEIP